MLTACPVMNGTCCRISSNRVGRVELAPGGRQASMSFVFGCVGCFGSETGNASSRLRRPALSRRPKQIEKGNYGTTSDLSTSPYLIRSIRQIGRASCSEREEI